MQSQRVIFRWWRLLAGLIGIGAYASSTILLDGPTYTVEFDAAHGCVVRYADRAGTLDLSTPLELAENFRLIVEDADGKRTMISGAAQALSRSVRSGNVLDLDWDEPLADVQGAQHDIAVHVTVTSDENAVTFDCAVENRSAVTVVEAWHAMLGGLEDFATPEQRPQTVLYPLPGRKTLEIPFSEYAMAYPSQLNMGFMDLNNAASGRGIYMGLHDKVARFKRFQFFETKKGNDATVTACVVHYPFIKTGETFQASPVVYRLHPGDWRAGARFYREWFINTFGLMDPSRDWIRRESFFQMIMMMLPEGNINYTFKQVPRLAKDGLKYGVRSLQLAGWQRGGHDNGYPYYEPDPRLGTWDDVADAIRECHHMGVKVYFFVNFQPVMLDLAWCREELKDYVTLNPFGETSWIAGWGMGTLASRMGDTVPLMAFTNVAFPRMSDILTGYFLQLVQAGADGLHVDKMFPGTLDYNPRLDLKPDTAPWEGAVRLMDRITRECGALNADFRMSFECNWDRILPFSNATWWAGNMTTAKIVFPEIVETVGHYMPYDFLGINRAVRLGYAVMVAPFNFNRSMDVKPWRSMARYIREVKRIRDGLTDIVYVGEPLPQECVRFADKTLTGGAQYAVWGSLKDGRRACIFTNDTRKPVDVAILGFEGNTDGPVEISIPFEKSVQTVFPVSVQIPAEGIVFVAEIEPYTSQKSRSEIITDPRSHGVMPGEKRPKTTQLFENADFEFGDLRAWTGDPNWRADNNAAGGWYNGWGGKWYAWSGQGGEQATGKLRSPTFKLSRPGVEILLAGWADNRGQTPDRWNYVTLNLVDGTELDRRYAPNSVTFTPVVLSGVGHVGAHAYVEAVDDAPGGSYSMLCIDEVSLVDMKVEASLHAVRKANANKVHVVENDLYRIEVNRKNGAIRRIFDKKGGLELIREPRLADNFDFTLPIRKAESWMSTEANFIRGRNQRLTACEHDGDSLNLKWDGPLESVFDEEYDASVSMRIALEGKDIIFSLHIDNRTALEIGEVYYPILGGMQGLGSTQAEIKDTVMALPSSAGLQSARPFHTFQNMSPFGTLYPEQFHRYPDVLSMPWLDLYSPQLRRGVYFGAHDPVARNKTLHLQLLPGAASQRADGNWPRPDELKGAPSGVRLCLVHIPYYPAGQPFEASPVVLRFHDGDWHAAAATYGQWIAAQSLGTATPCTEVPRMLACGRIPYAQLPEQAKAAHARGLNTLLLTDWKIGGQNNGIPRFEPDPSLGTPEDLKRAIEQCHAQNVRVVFLVNLQYVNPKTDAYRDELHRYVSTDRWGVPATWGERRFHMISPAFPEVHHMLATSVRALAALGADGVHLRDFFPTAMDFNPALPLTPDRASWEGGLACITSILKAVRDIRPDFQLSTQVIRDRLMSVASAAEVEPPEISPFREAFPEWRAFSISSGN